MKLHQIEPWANELGITDQGEGIFAAILDAGYDINVVITTGMGAMTSKRCSRCGEEKVVDEFYTTRGRYYAWCKPCFRAYMTQRHRQIA